MGAVPTSTRRRLLQQLIVLLDSFTFFKLLSCLSHRSFHFWSLVAVVADHVAFIYGAALIRTELLFTVPTTRDLGHGSGAMYLRTTPSRVPVPDDFSVTHTLANGEPSLLSFPLFQPLNARGECMLSHRSQEQCRSAHVARVVMMAALPKHGCMDWGCNGGPTRSGGGST